MASSSDNDDSSSSESDEDCVFYDANSSLSNNEIEINPLQREPRWRVSSKDELLKKPEHFCTISFTDKQLKDIERRDKLQRLRAQDNFNSRNNQNFKVNYTPESPSVVSSSKVEELTTNENLSSKLDLLREHIDSEEIICERKNSVSAISKEILTNYSTKPCEFYQQYSLPATSVRGTGGYYSNKKSIAASSEPCIVDLNKIDHITKFGELYPNSQKLNDDEILRQPIVLDLDSGKYIPLSDANPMTQKIIERTNRAGSIITLRHNSILNSRNNLRKSSLENNNTLSKSDMNLTNQKHATVQDDEIESTSSESSSTKSSRTTGMSLSSVTDKSSVSTIQSPMSIKKQLKNIVIKRFLRKKKIKKDFDPNNLPEIDDEDDDTERLLINDGSNGDLKYKSSRYLKEQTQFDKTQLLQTIVNAHIGPIWCMKFSPDGYLLATGGQDSLLKIWLLKSAQPQFHDFSHLTSNLSKQQNDMLRNRFNEFHKNISSETITPTTNAKLGLNEMQVPLYAKPFSELIGHQAPVLDVAWSKSLFLLSSSMDKTVRLWHITRLECLCYFLHVDFVSAIAFHPRDDRYFVSASLDGHIRLWNIPDKRVVHWTLIPSQASSQITPAEANLITAVHFCDDGRKVTAGTFDGRFLFYTDSLQYDTVINISDKDGSRSNRSRKRRKPSKITGIESMNSHNSKVLITSNDSRIRLYNIRTKEIERKYRGYSNTSSQIRASFSYDDRYIISGSEDSWFYIWRTEPNNNGSDSPLNAKLTRKQRRYFDRAYERIRVHNTMVTSAIFAPNPHVIMNYLYSSSPSSPLINRSVSSTPTTPYLDHNRARVTGACASSNSSEASFAMNNTGSIYMMVTADSKGQLKLLVNRYHR
ncbi:unnamed protein product [Rotaria socialis]|uniref:WD repeat-containing protein 44 n=1 Tax=Rotaria socialis TaxID=392032 RepID=A0A817UD71_9BILA|nr:unnamed protein product [Rotaria socialis]CAF3331997.1 unnamed protein product [Rotaria socialis]CAF3351695.1 unnamed protein product [Rotaria socialis]CAF3664724.1 unnamed protein product [Rotaria socialis]CAF4186090.1 unnamed protein product [Rotaria socialis]